MRDKLGDSRGPRKTRRRRALRRHAFWGFRAAGFPGQRSLSYAFQVFSSRMLLGIQQGIEAIVCLRLQSPRWASLQPSPNTDVLKGSSLKGLGFRV